MLLSRFVIANAVLSFRGQNSGRLARAAPIAAGGELGCGCCGRVPLQREMWELRCARTGCSSWEGDDLIDGT